MLNSNHPNQTSAPQEENIVRRRRYQKGSLQKRKHGKRRVWVVLYYDKDGHHRYHTVGPMAEFTKSQAQEEQVKFMETVNGGKSEPGVRPVLVGEFVTGVYLPFQRGKWKESTKGTTENRIQFHICGELGDRQLESFTPTGLQAFLEGKAVTSGFSIVDHLRWDLTSIFDLAVAEKVLTSNPAKALYTPPTAKKGSRPMMTAVDVETALGAVEFREEVILNLAIFSGLRPGELLALMRGKVAQDGRSVEIVRRVYRGKIGSPKNGESRTVAVPPRSAALLVRWLKEAVDPEPTALVFTSENRETPLWRDNLLRRYIRPALEKVNLGWVDFKVMRRTNASLGHVARVDPKVSADQRGHGIGVSLDVYTRSNIRQKGAAAKKLEDSVRGRKVVRMSERKAS